MTLIPGRILMTAAIASLALVLSAIPIFTGGTPAAEESFVRLVHGVSDAGPVDIYVDGRLAVIGAPFASVTDPLPITDGDHQIIVVPTGASTDIALVNSVVSIPVGVTEEIAIVGGGGVVTAVMFPVNSENLDEDRARIRIIHTSPDIGPLDPAVAGGDAIFPTVDYLYSTDYAEVPAGIYPMELRYAGTTTPAAVLPELLLAPGTVNDIYVIGQGWDGTLQTLQVQTDVTVLPRTGRVAAIRSGTCGSPGDRLADEWVVLDARGERLGGGGDDTASSMHQVPLTLETLIGQPTILTVRTTSGSGDNLCAPISGQYTDDGALILALRDGGMGPLVGIATISVGVEDPESVDVAVYVIGKSGEVPQLEPTAIPGS